MAHSALTQILILLVAVVLVVFLMRRLKLPPILGYLVVGIVGRDPAPETLFKEGDVVVLYGNAEALEHSETVLLMG